MAAVDLAMTFVAETLLPLAWLCMVSVVQLPGARNRYGCTRSQGERIDAQDEHGKATKLAASAANRRGPVGNYSRRRADMRANERVGCSLHAWPQPQPLSGPAICRVVSSEPRIAVFRPDRRLLPKAFITQAAGLRPDPLADPSERSLLLPDGHVTLCIGTPPTHANAGCRRQIVASCLLCLITFLIHNLLPLSHLFGWRATGYDGLAGEPMVRLRCAACGNSWGKALECVAAAPYIPLPYGENSARNEELRLPWCLLWRHHLVCENGIRDGRAG
ncbi:hypothetical protein HDV57DRAFT_247436 [Trichoderma longibrachiatum]|uniref:Uncharacterized protein n=1 Tax=Trichoderma longibrachiatum ATCC 18648 TaxID=983965 RepID=A0A2T4C9Q9_TRILO|nr:hypothetical protein M440DRAFT_1190066 [Trichoderma longibrachiatum ATCC 18648]